MANTPVSADLEAVRDSRPSVGSLYSDTEPLARENAGLGSDSDDIEPGADMALVVANFYTPRSALVAQAALVLTCLYAFIKVAQQPLMLFTYHPTFALVGVLLFAQAVLVVQPTSTPADKAVGGAVHGFLMVGGAASFLIALGVIVTNKLINNGAHLYSAHARLGLLTVILLTANVVGGATQFWVPQVYGSVAKAKSMYKFHRVAGYVVLVLTAATIVAATGTTFNKNAIHISRTVLLLGFGVAGVAVGSGVRRSKFPFKFRRM
ncbi:eukaryotic cytochrome b561-domain-containing protein [Dipodascopsis tothii]|uniref:eukaryotic cytochrome b561-domain-containing protein n=1 Tax=Dipodascopsis tothii TaxID=44089 RepID=UPI0034CE3486